MRADRPAFKGLLRFLRRGLDALRRRVLDAWFMADKGQLVFFAGLVAGVSLLIGIVWFAYADHLRLRWLQERHADLTCLSRNIYHEARGEPFEGQLAVAEVTLNRVASRRFPDSVCGVVYEKRFDMRRNRLVGAFSWTEFDSVERPQGNAWRRARRAAEIVYDRQRDPLVPGALFYHADRIRPDWAPEKKRLGQIGRHIFYE